MFVTEKGVDDCAGHLQDVRVIQRSGDVRPEASGFGPSSAPSGFPSSPLF
jgi:hypothetical protein